MDSQPFDLRPSRGSVHPNSNVAHCHHHPALVELLQLPVRTAIVDYLIDRVYSLVNYWLRLSGQQASSRKTSRFAATTTKFISRSCVDTRTIVVALSYLDRVRAKAPPYVEKHIHEYLAIGSIILAHKYLNDSTIQLASLARASQPYDVGDLKRMEMKVLTMVRFDLKVVESELLVHCEPIFDCLARRHGYKRNASVASTPFKPRRTHKQAAGKPVIHSFQHYVPPAGPSSSDPSPMSTSRWVTLEWKEVYCGTQPSFKLAPLSESMERNALERPTLPHLYEVIPHHLRHAPLPTPKPDMRQYTAHHLRTLYKDVHRAPVHDAPVRRACRHMSDHDWRMAPLYNTYVI